MKSNKRIMEENELLSAITCFLCKCEYGYKAKADKIGNTKPELLLQEDLKTYLEKKGYSVVNPFSINTSELNVCPSLKEQRFEIDLKVNKDNFDCYIEVKYDEVYKDENETKYTNSNSEDQVRRDAYKLQCLKARFPQAYYLIVFVTNNETHVKEFTSMPTGEQTITYNGQTEIFTLKTMETVLIDWKTPQCGNNYKYCIIKCN